MRDALRIRDFRLLWVAGLVSSLGSWLLVLAVPAQVFLVTGSVAATGLALAAEYLPVLLLGPVAGALTDRWDRRRLMVACDVFRAGAVGAMLFAGTPGRYWIFYAALAAESGGTVLFVPAFRARIPDIVGTGTTLSGANALSAVGSGIVRLVGGPLGGLLLAALGIRWLICADAASYLVSAAALLMTRPRPAGLPRACGSTIRALAGDLRAGLKVLRNQPAALRLLPVTALFLAANASLTAVLIPFGIRELGGSRQTGFLFAALGAGFLLGAPPLRFLLDRVPPRHLLAATLAAAAASYWLLFHSQSLGAALPAAAAVGMSGSMSLATSQTTVQRVIPGAALGRVSAVFVTCEAAATLTGAVAGPLLAQVAGLAGAALVASLTTLTAALTAYLLLPRGPVVPRRSLPRRSLPRRWPRPGRRGLRASCARGLRLDVPSD